MSHTTETRDAIFTAWHEQADTLLPEFNFHKTGSGNWKSGAGYKVTGEAGASGKVYYYLNTPFMLKDYTRGNKSLLQYIKEREGITDTCAVLQYMAAQVGIKYERFRSESDRQKYEEHILRAALLEDVNSFYIDSLTHTDNVHANSAEAAQLREYLKCRGYKATDLRPPASTYDGEARYMEVGFMPSYTALREYLEQKGHASDFITEVVARALPEAAGRTHRLTFPFRTAAGHIAGFAYRKTSGDGGGKYLYDNGLKKGAQLFNFRKGSRPSKDSLTIVEGLLDAFIAYARGIDNVVAIGGASLSEDQARLIINSCSSIRLCLDRDEAGRNGTDAAIELLQNIANEEGKRIRIYVSTLPEGVKDADELVTKHGAEAFRKVLDYSVREYEYEQANIAAKYNERMKPVGPEGELMYTSQDQEALIDEVVAKAAKYSDTLDRDGFLNIFISSSQGIYTPERIYEAVERMRRSEEELRQQKALRDLSYSIQRELKAGSTPAEVTASLKERIGRIETLRAADLLTVESYDALEAQAIISTESLYTGYDDLDRGFRYPAGGTTLIAGRTSHGKTAFMLNSILRMAQLEAYKDRKFFFFSYEEDAKKLLLKMLNCLIDENISAQIGSDYRDLNNEEALKKYMRDLQAKRIRQQVFIERKRDVLRDLLNSGRLVITDKRYTVEQLTAVLKSAAKKSDFGTAFIDYAQRIKTEKEYRERRTQIDFISAELAEVAKLIDRPIVVGAQLNRAAAQKGAVITDTRPRLEQLKESGALEEDANSVLTIYNEQAERIDTGHYEAISSVTNLEVQAPKNRDGVKNYKTVLLFDQSTRNIKDMTRDEVKKYYLRRKEAKQKKNSNTPRKRQMDFSGVHEALQKLESEDNWTITETHEDHKPF